MSLFSFTSKIAGSARLCGGIQKDSDEIIKLSKRKQRADKGHSQNVAEKVLIFILIGVSTAE